MVGKADRIGYVDNFFIFLQFDFEVVGLELSLKLATCINAGSINYYLLFVASKDFVVLLLESEGKTSLIVEVLYFKILSKNRPTLVIAVSSVLKKRTSA
jgi:hypothetical protein